MPNYTIETDLTVAGTKLIVDGKDSDKKLASISFFADAPNKKYSESGYISLNTVSFDDEGNVKRESFSKSENVKDIKPIGMTDEVVLATDDFTRYLGDEMEVGKTKLVKAIEDHCKENDIACPETDVLLSRSVESLSDKALDLGISIDNA